MKRRNLRSLLPAFLAICLLWYALRDLPISDLARQFRQANYLWLVAASVLMILFYLARAARWQLTLQALGYRPSLFRTTVALLAGTIASMVVPGAGELTRCGTLQRTDGVPLAQGVGSVVAERLIDIVMLVLIIGLTLLLEFNRVGQYMANLLSPLQERFISINQLGLLVMLIIGLLLFAGLVYILYTRQLVRQHRLIIRLLSIGRNLGKGFMGIRRLRNPVFFVILTLTTNLLVFLITYTLFFSSSLTNTLPPTAALTILAVSSIGGLAVPTQGGIGTYHFLVSRALMLYGMNESEGVVVATFLHALQTGFSLVLSSLSLLLVPVIIRQRARLFNRTM